MRISKALLTTQSRVRPAKCFPKGQFDPLNKNDVAQYVKDFEKLNQLKEIPQ